MKRSKKLFSWLGKTWVWVSLTLLALLLCLDIELKWFLIPCESKETVEACNRIILTISYSYIAAAIFHFIVNYCPQKSREKIMTPYTESKVRRVIELLRQCKDVVKTFDLSNDYEDRNAYVKRFSEAKLITDMAPFCTEKSQLVLLSELRSKIYDIIVILLLHENQLTEEQLQFIIDVENSRFIREDIRANEEMCDEKDKNQNEIGESIFDLNEKAYRLRKSIEKNTF